MLITWILGLLAIAVPFAAIAKAIPQRFRTLLMPIPALACFCILLVVALPACMDSQPVAVSISWIPQLGIDLGFVLNGLGLLLALLVTGIGTLIILYTGGYMGNQQDVNRLYALLYLFMFSMAGLSMADNMLVFFIFWELTSISSYFLIGFQHNDKTARNNALQALLVTGMGGMALLAGFILLASATGTWSISELTFQSDTVQSHPHYPWILALVLLGAFTKSAQFPFHFWLPNAMSAPTPVSAYLHSATMVKAGVFLLFLMLPVLGGTVAWTLALTIAGSVTLLAGVIFGMCQHDLKKILAGTTVAVLGLLTLLLGIGGEKGVLAALLFLFGHALYKATLFMVAGSIDHETGTRDIRRLGGLYKMMPWTASAALLAAMSKMGLPPLFGFLGKEYTYKASLSSDWVLTLVLFIGSAMMIALAVKAALFPFWRRAPAAFAGKIHEAPLSMRIGPLVLALTGVIAGSVPHLLEPLFSSAKSVAIGYEVTADVKLWQGFNLPLLLSVATLMVGLVIVLNRGWLETFFEKLPIQGPNTIYEIILGKTLQLASLQTRILQNGYLRNYLLTIVGAAGALILLKLWRFGGISDLPVTPLTEPGLPVITVLMIVAVILAITTNSRLTALLALGMVGFGVAWIFAIFSAPDLAITQILVETLTIVLFAWAVYKLPGFRNLSSRRTIMTDVVVSGVAGLLVTILVLKSQAVEIGSSISETLTEWSLSKAYGANVVNVILVDFRALDTLGEICVLAVAAIGVWALSSTSNQGNNS